MPFVIICTHPFYYYLIHCFFSSLSLFIFVHPSVSPSSRQPPPPPPPPPAAQNANANADFANFDAFGSTSGSTGGFPPAPQAPFQPSNTGRAKSKPLCHSLHTHARTDVECSFKLITHGAYLSPAVSVLLSFVRCLFHVVSNQINIYSQAITQSLWSLCPQFQNVILFLHTTWAWGALSTHHLEHANSVFA